MITEIEVLIYRYKVNILKTFDSNGTVNIYKGGIENSETPHFHGAGTGHYTRLYKNHRIHDKLMHAFSVTFLLFPY